MINNQNTYKSVSASCKNCIKNQIMEAEDNSNEINVIVAVSNNELV